MEEGPDALKAASEGRWVLRDSADHDTVGSLTLSTKPLLDSEYPKDITDEVDTGGGRLRIHGDVRPDWDCILKTSKESLLLK